MAGVGEGVRARVRITFARRRAATAPGSRPAAVRSWSTPVWWRVSEPSNRAGSI